METLLNHPRTVAFLELARKMGWRQADVVRQLGKSRAHISKIFSGKSSPSGALLELLQMKVDAVLREKAKLEEGARAAIPSGEQELNERLSFLRKHDPSGFRVVTTTIDILHKRAVEAGPADDTGNLIEKAAKEILEAGAADLARKRFLKPKPEAAGPPRDEDTRKK